MSQVQDALATIDEWVNDGVVQGAIAAVWHRGDIIASRVAGEAQPGTPVGNDTLFALASVSKPMTAAAVMHVLDNSGTGLDTPVSAILPQFSSIDDPFDDDAAPQLEALRDRVTFRHLLCHTSGLPENIGVKRIRMSDQPTLDQLVDAMGNLPLLSAPGAELRYSNAGLGLAARAASVIGGRDFNTILQEDILASAGLDNIVPRPDRDLDDRIAIVADAAGRAGPAESYNSQYWRDLGITWGGYFGSAQDVLRFAASFLPDQSSPLPPEVRREMTTDQTGGVPGGVNSAGVRWERGSWGLGWEVKGDKDRHWTGTLTSARTWCHWGQSGTLVWVDPDRELGLAVFGNRSAANAWPLRPPRWSDLSDAVVRATE
ncbi:MAG: beta-lactamase family protein [Chloroflexota bacterium]|jgi:CubicO group peptidase (beta-lactamase class C family)|nr:beta-lactamase family protein [Chloroflexota bacterium]